MEEMSNAAFAAVEAVKRQPGERAHQHRALLLWCMCNPERRAVRGIARVMAKNEATVRAWKKRWDWMTRSEHPMTEESAVHSYRMLYLRDYGPTELPEIADRITISMSTTIEHTPPPADVVSDLREAGRIARDEVLRKRGERGAVRASHVSLVDDALGYVVKAMADEKIRASLKDIPSLLKARAVLTGEAVAGDGAGVLATETVRVKQARQNGGSIYAAMRQDLSEFDVILTALETKEELENAVEVVEDVAVNGPTTGGLILLD